MDSGARQLQRREERIELTDRTSAYEREGSGEARHAVHSEAHDPDRVDEQAHDDRWRTGHHVREEAEHLRELAAMVAQGDRAVMLYLIQRADAESFSISGDLDPGYAEAFAVARAAGVEALAYRCRMSPEEITVDKAVRLVS